MAMVKMVEYDNAPPEVKAVYDDIMATRSSNWVNNFWKILASHPPTLRRVWAGVKEVMSPGRLDPLTKEMIYIAVSVANACSFCVHSHTAAARAKGMTDAQYAELLSIIAVAGKTNHLASALQVSLDPVFDAGA